MQTTSSVTAERARDLLRKNADLATWMAELGARGSAAAIALTGAGTPPPDDLIQELAEAGREFIALRAEVFALAAALGLTTPSAGAIDCTKRLDAMLRLLLEGLEAARRTTPSRAQGDALAVLDRVMALAHRDDPGFAALLACQARAAALRAKLKTATDVDADAIAPFAGLLSLIDGQQDLDDEQWGALEDAVAAAFGRPLAVAATRGKLGSS
ncbi:MAG: hypothetical protein E6K82_07120 [Candidatus Rokuibacteriota bacterium]|nr:MAG: hypothetical protein E6K82_07120 [Candidatus Rokubacteria bacterium]